MPSKELYKNRKEADLKELKSEVARLEGGGSPGIEDLQHRFTDAQNAIGRLQEAGADDWEAQRTIIDSAFRNCYASLEKTKRRSG